MIDKSRGPYEHVGIYRPHDEQPPRPRYAPVTEEWAAFCAEATEGRRSAPALNVVVGRG